MDKKLNILILEDVAEDAELIERELHKEKLKFSSKRVKTKKDFIKALSDYGPDLILSDYALPQFDGLSALKLSKKLAPTTPFILVSGTLGEELAIESLKSGATDYVMKQRLSRLGPVVRRALHEAGERDKRKRAEKELRASEENYRNLVDNSVVGIYKTNLKGDILYVNEALARIFEFDSAEEMMRAGVLVRYKNKKDRDELLENVKKRGKVDNFEIDVITKKGTAKKVILNSILNGEELSGMIMDITERKRSEQLIIEREKELRLIAESSLDTIFTITKTGKFTYISPSVKELIGYETKEIIGTTFTKYVPIKEVPGCWQAIKDVFINKVVHNFETYVKHRDGRLIPIEINGQLTKREKEWVVQGTIRNITQRRESDEALRQSEKKYRTLFEESKDVIYISSVDGKFIDINTAGVELFGYDSKDEILKINIAQDLFLNSKDRQHFQNDLHRDGFIKDWEAKLKKKNGQYLTVLISATAIKDDNGEIIAYRVVIRDITDKKMLEQQLLHAQKMEAIGTLSGGIAHDFNNILGAILGYTELTQYLVNENDPKIKDNLHQIFKAGLRAKELVQQILTFSRQAKFQLKPLRLELIVKEVVKLLRASIPVSIEIIGNIENECGYVYADAAQMHQVIMNLCTNAFHAMRDKGTGTLSISLKPIKIGEKHSVDNPNIAKGNYLKLSVSDTGHGIEPDTLKRIFDPFFTTKGSGQGTGLGLSVVHGIIESHKGAITVMSKPGEGSIFNIYLPKIEQSLVYESEEDQPIPPGTENILLVDDEEVLIHTGKQILENIGYKITGVADSLDALEMFRKDPDKFDLVITDQAMPKMRGIELAKKMLEIQPEIPIILVTGYSETLTRESVQKMGLYDMIIKPVLTQDFGSIVREALDSRVTIEMK